MHPINCLLREQGLPFCIILHLFCDDDNYLNDSYLEGTSKNPNRTLFLDETGYNKMITNHSGCGAKRLLGRAEQSRQVAAKKAGTHAAIGSNTLGVVSSTP